MLVEHCEAIGEAAYVSRAWCEIAADQAKQRGFSGTVGARDRDAFGTADRKGQRAEQAAVAMRHHHVLEGDEFATAEQGGIRPVDLYRRPDFDARRGFV